MNLKKLIKKIQGSKSESKLSINSVYYKRLREKPIYCQKCGKEIKVLDAYSIFDKDIGELKLCKECYERRVA